MKEKKKKLTISFAIRMVVIILVFISILNLIVCAKIKKETSILYSSLLEQTTKAYSGEINRWIDGFINDIKKYTQDDVIKTKDEEAIVAWLRKNRYNQNVYWEDIFFAGKDGLCRFSTNKPSVSIKDRDYYKKIINEKNEYVIGSPTIAKSTGKMVFHIAYAVKDRDGNIFGMMVGSLSLDTVNSLTREIKIGKSGYGFLLSSTGEVINHPNADLVLKANFTDTNGNDNENSLATLAKKMISLESGTGKYTDSNGKVYYVSYSPISCSKWSLGISVTEDQVYEIGNDVKKMILELSNFIIAGMLIASLLLLGRIVKPIKFVEKTIKDIATGDADLTKSIQINRKDEIGRLVDGFNMFVKKLHSIVSNIKTSKTDLVSVEKDIQISIEETTSAITEILSNIQSVGSQINNQSSSVEETASAVTQIAQNITSLDKMIENQSSSVSEASSAIEQMIGNINSVDQSVSKMANSFLSLETNTREGMDKQSDVNERVLNIANQSEMLMEANAAIASIASQTNMLAMNAAIEAAHAGEAGKGFSVVADEIRKLSETSSEQSKTIGEELTKIMKSIQEVVDVSHESEETFSSVSVQIQQTDELVRQIKCAMEEQKEGSDQIYKALTLMNDSTSEVKSAANEMSSGNKAILEEVKILQDASEVIKESILEMTAGAKQINGTGINLKELSDKLKDAIEIINNEIDLFKV